MHETLSVIWSHPVMLSLSTNWCWYWLSRCDTSNNVRLDIHNCRYSIFTYISAYIGPKKVGCDVYYWQLFALRLWFIVFNATFNNISVMLWRSVLLVKKTWVPKENHWPVTSHWQTLSHNIVSSTPCYERGSKSHL